MPELSVFDWISWACIVSGAFFAVVGSLGILRLPDVFSRMHGAGMVDTLGCWLILIGLMFQTNEWIVIVKLGLIIMFIAFTSPTTTFALSRAAILGGLHTGPKHNASDKKDAKPSNT
ncbi:MAG: monovalent cation/H(+) antiporter subunit G [Magnetovibrio sp.]|nr:monovalent cation/H(+) antiporter subunit G [Magnetovibrio sp.]